MKTKSTYTGAGWDFVGEAGGATEGIWDICQVTNYPRLVWRRNRQGTSDALRALSRRIIRFGSGVAEHTGEGKLESCL
jgi:hypothetical protein